MNLTQYLQRWPAKDARLFLFAGGKDHDRLAIHALTADHWTKRVDKLDVVRLHQPNLTQLDEALRRDPLMGKVSVVVATELIWEKPDEPEHPRALASLTRLLDNWPRDLCLIASTPEREPDTKNDLAQAIIRKGYWVVLKSVDVETACETLKHLSGWSDDELIREIVLAVGTDPSSLIATLRVLRLAGAESPDEVRSYLQSRPHGTVFDVVEALVVKDAARALSLLNEDITLGQLVGALDRKLTSLLQFMGEMKRGRSPKEATLALRLPGFIAHGLYEASKRWTTREILELYPVLADLSTLAPRQGSPELLVLKVAA